MLFLRERDPEREVWDGRRLGVEAAAEALGVSAARACGTLGADLPQLLAGYESVLYPFGRDEAGRPAHARAVLAALRRNARGLVRPPSELLDPRALLHELRLF